MTRREPPPPHDLEAEISVLGAVHLLLAPARDRLESETATDVATAGRVFEMLRPEDFYRPSHGEVFRVMSELHSAAKPIDPVLLREELQHRGMLEKVGGTKFIARIVALVPTAANALHYATIVRDCARRRELVRAGELVRQAALTGEVLQIERAFAEFDRVRAPEQRQSEHTAAFASRVRRADQLLLDDSVADDQNWIISDGILQRGGVSFLTAPLKVGKTIAALGLAVDLAAGLVVPNFNATFLGSPIVAFGPVLYMCAEGGDVLLKKRIRRMSAGLGAHALAGLHYDIRKPRPDLGSDRDVRAVYRYARDQGCVAVLWDPLGRFWRPEDEADPSLARDVMDRVEAESVSANVGTVLCHHETKSDATEKLTVNAGRGSGRLGDDASGSIINLIKKGKRNEPRDSWLIYASFLVRDGMQLPVRSFRIDSQTSRLVAAADDDAAPRPSRRSGSGAAAQTVSDLKILRVLRELGEWTPIKLWAEAVGLSRTQLHDRLQPLLDNKEIERRPGKYSRLEYRVKVSEVSDADRPTGREA